MAGETMWFKIYVVDGSTHRPLDMSKVAYLEVLDKAQKPVLQAKTPLKEGSGSGSLYLPVSLQSGNFSIRAYTSWMKNFSPDFYFEKPITLVNSFLKPALIQQEAQAAPVLSFFPEGGNLVEGVRSKVAFKATDAAGKGLDFEGAVLDEHQDTIALLEPLKFGMGSFYFTPEAGKTYQAIIQTGSGDSLSYPLPAAAAEGYVMHLQEGPAKAKQATNPPSAGNTMAEEEIRVSVQSNLQMTGYVYLLVHTRQQLKIARAGLLKEGRADFMLDKTLLEEGISHLTIFDGAQQPVCERLNFKQPLQELQIKAETEKEVYALREKVEIDITACHDTGAPVPADLSVAVYQLDSLQGRESNTIFSYLWLSSDLKGEIEAPEYYVQHSGDEVKAALDHLMLTHGWRRFRWEDVLQQNEASFRFLPEYEGQMLEVRVLDKDTEAPAANVLTYLSIPGKRGKFYTGMSNKEGEVRIIAKDFYGQKDLILQTSPQGNSRLNFQIQSPFSSEFSSGSPDFFTLSPLLADKLRARSIHLQVENVYGGEEKTKVTEPSTAGRVFYGAPFKHYLLDDYTRFPTMEEVMREYVYEVMVRKRKGRFNFFVFNPLKKEHFDENPLVLFNGVPVFDIDKLMAFNPLKIESLEVVNESFFLGGIPYAGIVSYATCTGEMEGFELNPDILQVSYEGLQQSREFYVPRHEKDSDQQRRMPDFRSLLYWSPEVQTDAQGKQRVIFYTSDLEGEFQVEIQGMTKEGKAAAATFTFKAAEKPL
jgi:hypothetical protein